MSFESYFINQLTLHPLMQPADIAKLCFQAAFGAEHLLQNISSAEMYFNHEYNSIPPSDGLLYEMLSDNVCRINLAVWKYKNLPSKWLFQMFVASATVIADDNIDKNELFLHYLNTSQKLLCESEISFSMEQWNDFLTSYKKLGMPPVHHSETYRTSYVPAYRIVKSRFLRLLPILEKIMMLYPNILFDSKNSIKVIAIDGRAASGKSTMAEDLHMILGADVIKMDDFFLPFNLRNDKRLKEAGGNIHYERFIEEVLPNLHKNQSFSYRKFNCVNMNYNGEIKISTNQFRIVEGVYSLHPKFGSYADITVFSDIPPEQQMKRIVKRNGAIMAKRFETEWIPMEENYFKEYKIQEKVSITL